MKILRLGKALLVFLLILLPTVVTAQALSPILSTDDLAQNLKNPDVVVVDIRKVEDYKAGHIPGAVGVFYNNWAPGKSGLQNEIPADDDLIDLLSANGIQPDSVVVVYGTTATGADRVNVTRVAWTLKYAGLQKVSVMTGGFEKWFSEKKEVSQELAKPKAKTYKGKFNREVLAKKDYVKSQIGKAIIVDTREAPFFSGQQKLPFVAKAGHIMSAVNLPNGQVFTKLSLAGNVESWIYKDADTLKNMATGVIGNDLSQEIIVYCDSGRVASAWWFILSEVLGYKDVKNYDGSMEEWTKDPAAPVEP